MTFTVKKEGTSGGWQTTITAWNDETVDDLKGRIRDYLEAEHGLKFFKKNFWLAQNGQHVPYKEWLYSIDSKEPLGCSLQLTRWLNRIEEKCKLQPVMMYASGVGQPLQVVCALGVGQPLQRRRAGKPWARPAREQCAPGSRHSCSTGTRSNAFSAIAGMQLAELPRCCCFHHVHCTLQGWRSPRPILVIPGMEVCSFASQAKISS